MDYQDNTNSVDMQQQYTTKKSFSEHDDGEEDGSNNRSSFNIKSLTSSSHHHNRSRKQEEVSILENMTSSHDGSKSKLMLSYSSFESSNSSNMHKRQLKRQESVEDLLITDMLNETRLDRAKTKNAMNIRQEEIKEEQDDILQAPINIDDDEDDNNETLLSRRKSREQRQVRERSLTPIRKKISKSTVEQQQVTGRSLSPLPKTHRAASTSSIPQQQDQVRERSLSPLPRAPRAESESAMRDLTRTLSPPRNTFNHFQNIKQRRRNVMNQYHRSLGDLDLETAMMNDDDNNVDDVNNSGEDKDQHFHSAKNRRTARKDLVKSHSCIDMMMNTSNEEASKTPKPMRKQKAQPQLPDPDMHFSNDNPRRRDSDPKNLPNDILSLSDDDEDDDIDDLYNSIISAKDSSHHRKVTLQGYRKKLQNSSHHSNSNRKNNTKKVTFTLPSNDGQEVAAEVSGDEENEEKLQDDDTNSGNNNNENQSQQKQSKTKQQYWDDKIRARYFYSKQERKKMKMKALVTIENYIEENPKKLNAMKQFIRDCRTSNLCDMKQSDIEDMIKFNYPSKKELSFIRDWCASDIRGCEELLSDAEYLSKERQSFIQSIITYQDYYMQHHQLQQSWNNSGMFNASMNNSFVNDADHEQCDESNDNNNDNTNQNDNNNHNSFAISSPIPGMKPSAFFSSVTQNQNHRFHEAIRIRSLSLSRRSREAALKIAIGDQLEVQRIELSNSQRRLAMNH